MTVNDSVKGTIQKLENLCESYYKNPIADLEELEESVSNLSCQVQILDIASDQNLKSELNVLQGALNKLASILETQQNRLSQQMQEIHLHQKALCAFSKVANNNFTLIA